MKKFKSEHNEKLLKRLFGLLQDAEMPHAVLFEGSDNKTRSLFANEVAKGLVCTQNNKPCNSCIACSKAENGNHPDIINVCDGLSSKTISVDRIREVREDAFIIPNESDRKVYILEDADNTTVQAANALLKVLEEPPASAFFILTCSSASVLLETIRSRCQIFCLQTEDYDLGNEKNCEIVVEVVEGLFKSTAFDLLRVSSLFLKDRVLFLDVLDVFSRIVYEAIIILSTNRDNKQTLEISKRLASKFTCKALFALLEEISNFQKMAEQNCNMALLTTDFCSKLYKIAVL